MLSVLDVLVASGVKVPTALVARVVCMLVAVEVWLILGVLGLEGNLEPSGVSIGGYRGTLPQTGSVCRLLT